MWFVYFTYYAIEVVGLSDEITGWCVFSGQITDGIMTPIVGVLSDKFENRIGKRMIWFIIGTIIVLPCFIGIFGYFDFVNCKDSNGDLTCPMLQ